MRLAGAQCTADTTRAAADSLRLPADSSGAQADTSALKADTAATSSGIDSVVTYTATDSIVYDVAHRVMRSRGKATIDYKELGLKADQIDIHWTTSQFFARGSVDTTDTTGHGMKGIPDLIDGGETYHGSEIAYNFKIEEGAGGSRQDRRWRTATTTGMPSRRPSRMCCTWITAGSPRATWSIRTTISPARR